MCHFSQADTAKAEVAVIPAGTSADLASVVIAHCELLVFRHFCNPCFGSHKFLTPYLADFLNGIPMYCIKRVPSLSFLALVTNVMFIP